MTAFLMFLFGLVLLVVGAEALVRGASKLALAAGISPLVVGLTVVALGTSSPEMAVSAKSALAGQADLAMGNVVGSNIFNVLFILGVSALIVPLLVARQLVQQEVPIMVGVSLLLGVLALDARIGALDGALLLTLTVVYTVFVIRQSRRQGAAAATTGEPGGAGQAAASGSGKADAAADRAADSSWDRHWSVQLLLVAAGLALLVLGADLLVKAAVTFARRLGVSELVIGLTILAAGTSLPEVATSILAAVRGQRDIAVGNVVGSNIFNILGVLALAALVSPDGLRVAPSVLAFDLPVMIVVALACLPIFFTGHLIARWEGAVFVALYVAYTAYLILAAQQHDALRPFSLVMASVVLPVLGLTVAVVAWREWRARRAA